MVEMVLCSSVPKYVVGYQHETTNLWLDFYKYK